MMAKKFKKVISLMMVTVLCFGMLNLGVVAVEGFTPVYSDSTAQIEGEDLPVYHVHGSADTVEDALVANRETDPEVYASKTIYPTADENYFEIELMVETSEKITEIRSEPDAAVALVIDYSSSMKEKMNSGICVHCGEEEENAERTETYIDRRGREQTRVVEYHECIEGHTYEEDPTTKMDAAIDAAQDFVRAFAADATTGKRWISVTIFDEEATTLTDGENGSWVDVATAGGLQSVLDAIGGIVADRGTNVAHGLALGSAALDEETVAELQHKYVVLVGDGLPYDSYTAPSGNYAKYSTETDINHVNAEKWARKIREGQGTQVFSVYVEENGSASSAGYRWFDTFSNQTVLATNTTTLVQAFEQQLAFISFGIEAWSVTDPMGANIEFVDKVSGQNNYSVVGDTLTWNLINDIPVIHDADGIEVAAADMVEGEAYTFIYTFRYGIRLDNAANGFVEGDYYAANGNTYLQYYLLDGEGNPIDLNGNSTATLLKLDFVVPAVQGYLGEFAFSKESPDGEPLAGAQFKLSHAGRACVVCGGAEVADLTATSDEEGVVTFSGIPSGHSYTLTETVAPEGYELSGDVYDVVVSYDQVTISINGDVVEEGFSFVNQPLPAYGPLTIVKDFAGDQVDASADLAFVVTNEEGVDVATVAYAEFVDGAFTIESLVEGTYTVSEINAEVEGYTLSVSSESETAEIVDETGAEVSFTNTYTRIPDPGSLTITKEFVDLPEEFYPAGLTFTVAGPEGYEGETSVTLNNDNDWSYTIDNAPIGEYTVTEHGASADGYELISTTYNGKEKGTVTVAEGADTTVAVVNTYEPVEKFGSLHFTKSFGEVSELHEGNWPEGGRLTIMAVSDTGEYTIELPTASGSWSGGFDQLPLGTYTVVESDSIEGYSFTRQVLVNGEPVEAFELTEDGLDVEVVNTYTKDTVYGGLTITKEFAGETVPLPVDLTFVVSNAAGDRVAAVSYADFVDGSYTVDALPVGEYTVTESGANVTGYDLSVTFDGEPMTAKTVEVTEDGAGVTIVNSYAETQKFGDLTIAKTYSGVDDLPESLTFDIYDSSGEMVESIAYGSFVDGVYVLEQLPVGDYTVTETGADMIGYGLTATVENEGLVTVTENGGRIAFHNDYSRNTATIPGSASITVEKVDEKGELITRSAAFGLFRGEKRVATARTSGGIATFTFGNDGIPAGEYTLKEVSAPRGYLRTDETWTVVATASSSVSENDSAVVTSWNWTASVDGAASVKVVNEEDKADVVLDKYANAAAYAPGDIFTYTLKVTNVGTQDATAVTVVDNLPAEVYYWDEIVSAQFEYDDALKRVTWTPGDLAVGESKEITFKVKMKLNLADGITVVNEAYAVWDEDPTTFHKDIENVSVDVPDPIPDPTPDPVDPGPYVPPYIPPVEEEPIVIDEPEVPLVDEPPVEEEPIEIEEPEVPLADVPKTGDPLMALLAVLGVSGAGFTGLTLRKGKDEYED